MLRTASKIPKIKSIVNMKAPQKQEHNAIMTSLGYSSY